MISWERFVEVVNEPRLSLFHMFIAFISSTIATAIFRFIDDNRTDRNNH